jgi:hypothetical protein
VAATEPDAVRVSFTPLVDPSWSDAVPLRGGDYAGHHAGGWQWQDGEVRCIAHGRARSYYRRSGAEAVAVAAIEVEGPP